MKEDLVNRRMEEIMHAGEDARIYDDKFLKPGQKPVPKDIQLLNHSGLREHLVYALDNAQAVLERTVVSFEDMHRWKERIQKEFDRQVADTGLQIELFSRFASARAEMMDAIDLPEVSGNEVLKGYLVDALKDHFKGKDISDLKIITPDFMTKHKGSVMLIINSLSQELIDKVAETKATLKKLAGTNPKPNGVHLQLLGVDKLENRFRQDADLVVEAFASQKKGPAVSFFHAIEEEVAAIVKKEAEAAKKQQKGAK